MLSHYSIGREKKKKSSLAWVLLVLRNKIEMQSDAVPVASRQARGQLGQLRVFVKKNVLGLGLMWTCLPQCLTPHRRLLIISSNNAFSRQ